MARPERPGAAWIWDANASNGKGKKKGKWVKPTQPANSTWDDAKGWITQTEAATDWGLALSVINSDKELKTLFAEAWNALKTGQEWSQATFTAKLQATKWYTTRTEQQRAYYTAKNDPSQAKELEARVQANMASLRTVAANLGATLSDTELRTLADENLMNGWNEAQINARVADYIKFSADPTTGFQSLIGAAGTVEDRIRGFAKQMGVEVDNDFVLQKAQAAVQAGNDTQAAEDFIRARAKERYAAFANELDTSTVEELSYNYRSSMANLLEIGIDEVSMNDSLIRQAMSVGDGQGGKKNLFEFEQELRQDPRWATTKNAKESSSTIVNDVLSTFGLI